MSTPKGKQQPSRRRIRQRTKQLRRAINAMDYVASGHIHLRTMRCGRDNCRCAQDPHARHGPYYQWSRRQDGRQVHRSLTPQQAKLLADAIANLRAIQELLAVWERETAAEILNPDDAEES
jgi:hypothetical protein